MAMVLKRAKWWLDPDAMTSTPWRLRLTFAVDYETAERMGREPGMSDAGGRDFEAALHRALEGEVTA